MGASNHGWVTLWDIATGKERFRLSGHEGSIQAVSVSPDGHFLLSGSEDLTARLWDVQTGKETKRFEGHTGWVTSVAFTPDGRTLVTSGGVVKFWDAVSGRELATMGLLTDGNWVVVDAEGRYDASEPDSTGLHFVAGRDVIELSQLKQRFYTPGLLGRIVRGEKFPVIDGSLHDVRLAPDVEVQAPGPGSARAEVHLVNRGGGLGKLIAKVNGRELPDTTRGSSANAISSTLSLDLTGATLSPSGKNVIEVFAESSNGLLRSHGFALLWQREPANEPAPNLFAVVVGISNYDNPSIPMSASGIRALFQGIQKLLLGSLPIPVIPPTYPSKRTICAAVRFIQFQGFVSSLLSWGIDFRRGRPSLFSKNNIGQCQQVVS